MKKPQKKAKPRPNFKRRYAGSASQEFWAEVIRRCESERKPEIYQMAVRLQNAEEAMLNVLNAP